MTSGTFCGIPEYSQLIDFTGTCRPSNCDTPTCLTWSMARSPATNSNPATIALGHNLGLELVAEGVETAGQRDRLNQLGCDMLQGFLYSRPLPAEEVIPFLKSWATGAVP